MIYSNALHFTKSEEQAKDLAQEIFLKIWLQRHRLTSVISFRAYLFTIARNQIYDALRILQRSPAHQELMDVFYVDSHSQPDYIETKELQCQINSAIAQLPERMQEAFRLSRFEGYSHEEICKKMKISRFTSQNYIARAVVAIRKNLDLQKIVMCLPLTCLCRL